MDEAVDGCKIVQEHPPTMVIQDLKAKRLRKGDMRMGSIFHFKRQLGTGKPRHILMTQVPICLIVQSTLFLPSILKAVGEKKHIVLLAHILVTYLSLHHVVFSSLIRMCRRGE